MTARPAFSRWEVDETTLIGALLVAPTTLQTVRGIVTATSFDSYGCQYAFEALTACADAGEVINAATVGERLRRASRLDAVGGIEWLRDLERETPPSPTLAEDCARRVRHGAEVRALAAVGERLRDGALDPTVNLPDVVRLAVEKLAPFVSAPAGDARRSRLRPKTLEEIMDAPAPGWLVRDLVPDHGVNVMIGAPNCGKTFAAIDLGMSVARGIPWFGRRTKLRGVVYVACEGNLTHRAAAYLKRHGLDAAELADRFRIVDSAVDLLDDRGDLLDLIEQIREAEADMLPVGLVIVDTLNRAMPGGDENSGEDMGRIIASAKRIETAFRCAVLFLHHTGKDEQRGPRGHSSLNGAIDLGLKVSGDSGLRTMSVVKLRDGLNGQAFTFELEPVDLGPRSAIDPDADEGERITSCVVMPCDSQPVPKQAQRQPSGKNQRVVLQAIRDLVSSEGEAVPGTSSIPSGARVVCVDSIVSACRHLLKCDDKDKPQRIREAVEKLREQAFVGICESLVWLR